VSGDVTDTGGKNELDPLCRSGETPICRGWWGDASQGGRGVESASASVPEQGSPRGLTRGHGIRGDAAGPHMRTSVYQISTVSRRAMRQSLLLIWIVIFFASPVCAQEYVASPDVLSRASDGETIEGVVFEDTKRTGTYDAEDRGIEGVLVSNGRNWDRTGPDGAYELPVRDDMDLTIVQPAGWRVPTDERFVPQFYYVHKPGGTGYDLRFGGLPDTGPAPARVNFPLIRDGAADDTFSCAVMGDPQTYSNEQIGFLRDGVVTDVINSDLEAEDCMILMGDLVGDDLGLLDRVLEVTGSAGVPQWPVFGNHDIDLDARSNKDKADTWRRLVGPTYYAFEKGNVLFVSLDNVVYPCGEADVALGRTHCTADSEPSYNGRITEIQFQWLSGLLSHVPEDQLIVLSTHIPLVSFVTATSGTHQTDGVNRLYDLLEERDVLSLAGHTHSLENHAPGQHFEGWSESVGAGPLPFRHIIVGAASGDWFQGDFNTFGVPEAIQRLGAPPGYLRVVFDGTRYEETYRGMRMGRERGQWVGLNTPAFREWYESIAEWEDKPAEERDSVPPRSINDLPDPHLLTPDDFARGVWLTANVWAGSDDTVVEAKLPTGETLTLKRTQDGEGEGPRVGAEWADPFATARQLSVARRAYQSRSGDERAQGIELFRGSRIGPAPPGPQGSAAARSMPLWRVKLPELPLGVHVIPITSTNRHGRSFTNKLTIEVREDRPPRYWRREIWE